MFILRALIEILYEVISGVEYLLMGYIMLGWFVFFGVIKNNDGFLFRVYVFLVSKIEPLLSKIRRVLPPVMGLDLSILAIFLILHLVVALINAFYTLL
ncbi:MAG: YggT family protein [Holosporales bacterium]|jgi:YggT family protein|nr:YggT family protein [Holosporales bacterium]